jgi:Rieske Fe-S protein
MIVVLPPEASLVEVVRERLHAAGWSTQESQGDEQAVLVVEGCDDPEGLEQLLADVPDHDVVPILSRREFRRKMGRRRFMTAMSSGLGVLSAMGLGVPVVGFLLPPRETFSTPDLVRAGRVSELEENRAKTVRLLGTPVLLIRTMGERYFALSAVCTHMDICSLEWDEERQQLVCPCHGGAFDVYGNVVQGPPSVPLRTFGVEQVGDELYVERRG